MKKIYFALAVVATAMLSSCVEEQSFNEMTLGENELSFVLNGVTTKSADFTPQSTAGVTIPIGDDGQGKGRFDCFVKLFQKTGLAMMGILDNFRAEFFRLPMGKNVLLTRALHVRHKEDPAGTILQKRQCTAVVHIQGFVVRTEKLQ